MIGNADWRGRRIAFAALRCPSGCGKLLEHRCLESRMAPRLKKKKQIEENVVQRAARDISAKKNRIHAGTTMRTTMILNFFESCRSWKVLKELKVGEIVTAGGPPELVEGYSMVPVKPCGALDQAGLQVVHLDGSDHSRIPDPQELLSKYSYYECFKCREPYCGGLMECEQNAGDAPAPKPETVQCNKCQLDGKGGDCPKHGSEFMAVKCDFCCNEALFRCFSNTMFCNSCHSNNVSAQKVKPCDPEQCPVRGKHPEGRTYRWMMGCAACDFK